MVYYNTYISVGSITPYIHLSIYTKQPGALCSLLMWCQVTKERLCVNPRMPKGPSGNPPKRNTKERMDHNTMPKTTTTEMPANTTMLGPLESVDLKVNNALDIHFPRHQSSYSQLMIGVSNHLLSVVSSFHETILRFGEPGSLGFDTR